jgi:cytochrome c oxidase assembly protein subunit 15
MIAPTSPQPDSPWPHRLAVLLVCATFPLIWVGGLVTTYQAGMAVEDWPSTYGYNIFLYPWQTWVFGPWDLFIEHGHRLLGTLAGMLTIALVAVVYRYDRRVWLRWTAVGALAAVIAQGSLGGARVLLDDRQIALLHGCFGPAFFALCVALAVFTSRWWKKAAEAQPQLGAGRLHRVALLTTLLAYVQLILGANLRHISLDASPGTFRALVFMHLLIAAIVTVHVFVLAAIVWSSRFQHAALRRPALGLCVLMVLQLVLGGGTWVAKYAWPDWMSGYQFAAAYTIVAESLGQALTVTAHVATGSLILVTSLLVALRALRLYPPRLTREDRHTANSSGDKNKKHRCADTLAVSRSSEAKADEQQRLQRTFVSLVIGLSLITPGVTA